METAFQTMFTIALVILALLLFACLIRAIKGPKVADRIVAINMMSTLITIVIAVLAVMLGEGYLVDVALVYAMMGFLAVVLLSKIYTGVYLSRKRKEGKEDA